MLKGLAASGLMQPQGHSGVNLAIHAVWTVPESSRRVNQYLQPFVAKSSQITFLQSGSD